jgi:hypothetical protein
MKNKQSNKTIQNKLTTRTVMKIWEQKTLCMKETSRLASRKRKAT